MEKSEGKNLLEDPGVDGRIILKWIFTKWERVVGTVLYSYDCMNCITVLF